MQIEGQVNSAISISFLPPACPTITHSAITDDERPYLDEDRNQLMDVADGTPFNEDGELQSRVEERLDYSKKRGYKKLGVAFCVSMLKEAQALSRPIEAAGMTIIPLLICERGRIAVCFGHSLLIGTKQNTIISRNVNATAMANKAEAEFYYIRRQQSFLLRWGNSRNGVYSVNRC